MNKKDYIFVKNFSNITIKNICRNLKLDAGNVSSGRVSNENYKKIKNELKKEIGILFLEDITKQTISDFINNLKTEVKELEETEDIETFNITLKNIKNILKEMEIKLNGDNSRAL